MSGGDSFGNNQSRREIGEEFESWLNMNHEMAGLRGALAHVVHNPPPSKVVHGRVIWSEAAVADYSGCMHGGIVLAAEAKSVKPGGRLPKSRISSKQQEHLDAVMAAGGLALLLVEFRVDRSIAHRRYAIPWYEVPWKILKTAESLDEGDLAIVYQVPAGTDYLARFHKGSDKRYVVGERRKRVYPTE